MIRAKSIPGNKIAMRCNDGRTTIKMNKRINVREGWRPYFELQSRKSNQMKNGSKAMKVNRKDRRHIEKVKNLGAKEKQSDANQRLR